jgi:hypothetical protein
LFKTALHLTRGGETGIFSPMHLLVCRKPAWLQKAHPHPHSCCSFADWKSWSAQWTHYSRRQGFSKLHPYWDLPRQGYYSITDDGSMMGGQHLW